MHMALSTKRFSPSFERSDEEAQHHPHHPAGASLLIDASHLSRTALSLSGERRGSPASQHQSVSQPSRKRKLHSSPHHSPQSQAESSLSPASEGEHSHAEESDDTDGSTYDPDPSYQDTSRRAFSSNKRARKSYRTSASSASRDSTKQGRQARFSPPHSNLSPSSLESSFVPTNLTASSAAHQTAAHPPATSAANWPYRSSAQHQAYLTAHHQPHSAWQSTYASAPPSFVEAGSRYSSYHPHYSSSQHQTPAISSAHWNMQSPRFVDDRPAVAPASISRPWPPSHASLDAGAQPQPDPPAFSIRPGPVQKKRGKLPEEAISVMKAWLFANTHHPYPSDSQKREMCSQTGLSPQQVSNWFINARRRILKRGNEDWPPQAQAGDSVSPEMPPAGVKYDKVPTELENENPQAPASPTYGSNPPAGYSYGPYGGQRNSPPQGSPIYQSQQPPSYPYQVGEQGQPYLPPPVYPFGRPASQQGYLHSSREGADSYARYGSSHFRSSPYLRPPPSQDERPSPGRAAD